MNRNEIGNKGTRKTRWNRLGKILAALAIMLALVGSVQVAEAKVWYTLYDVRYEHSDIPSNLQSYINYVEYDAEPPVIGKGYGVRLYLYDSAKYPLGGPNGMNIAWDIAGYIKSNREWRGDRSQASIKEEIKWHAIAAFLIPARINPIHIEYYYCELKDWEVPYYGRI